MMPHRVFFVFYDGVEAIVRMSVRDDGKLNIPPPLLFKAIYVYDIDDEKTLKSQDGDYYPYIAAEDRDPLWLKEMGYLRSDISPIIPIIRNILPSLIAKEIVGVQPMSNSIDTEFKKILNDAFPYSVVRNDPDQP